MYTQGGNSYIVCFEQLSRQSLRLVSSIVILNLNLMKILVRARGFASYYIEGKVTLRRRCEIADAIAWGCCRSLPRTQLKWLGATVSFSGALIVRTAEVPFFEEAKMDNGASMDMRCAG